jgi:hypothetical protein
MPDWAIKGPLFNAMDMAGKEFGVTTPDLSSNIRHSSFLDVSTLPVQFFMDQVNLTGTAVKQLVKLASNAAGGSYPGATVQQQKDAIKGVPVVLENVLRVELEDKISNETNVAQYTSKDAGRYRRTGQEKALAYLGLKGKDEGEFMDRDYNKSWNERNEKNKMSKLTDEILANLDNPKVIQGRAEKIFELKGMKGIEEAIARVQEVQQARATDAQERGVLSALSNPDYVAQAKALQQLKNFRPSK